MIKSENLTLRILLDFLNDPEYREAFHKNSSAALYKKGLRSLENTPEVNILAELGLEELSLIAELNNTEEDVHENIGAGVIF